MKYENIIELYNKMKPPILGTCNTGRFIIELGLKNDSNIYMTVDPIKIHKTTLHTANSVINSYTYSKDFSLVKDKLKNIDLELLVLLYG